MFRPFLVERTLSKNYGDGKFEFELWPGSMPEKPRKVSYSISVYLQSSSHIKEPVEFTFQLHGDRGTTSEIHFDNIEPKVMDVSVGGLNEHIIILEKNVLNYYTGNIHTLVLYSKNYQYLYVNCIIVKLPHKTSR